MPDRKTTLKPYLDNDLPAMVDDAKLFAGSAGESPSRYSRSPSMWNAAFKELGLDAAYVPFDIRSENLRDFIATVRELPGFIGGNVTVPHKLAIMELLDEIDPLARSIGAVNTYVRTAEGKLIGYNTDADGLIGSIQRKMPGQSAPFLESVKGKNTLLLGAGGAGKAAAFILGSRLDGGTLSIMNRSFERAKELADAVSISLPNVQAVPQEDVLGLLSKVDLVVNASTVGQSGIRHLPGGMATCLEAFSSLTPAEPAVLPLGKDEAKFYRACYDASVMAIHENNLAAAQALARMKPTAAFVDAVYSPAETVLLRQARLHGHQTLNGKGMLVTQAAESFIKRMARAYLVEAGYDPDTLYDRVLTTMTEAFGS
jgi:shikimate dehydrogenase